jgi:hypothetical protein
MPASSRVERSKGQHYMLEAGNLDTVCLCIVSGNADCLNCGETHVA